MNSNKLNDISERISIHPNTTKLAGLGGHTSDTQQFSESRASLDALKNRLDMESKRL